jgi:hypothetical protein
MIEKTHGYDVIVDFWEWYQRRNDPKYDPLASLALDKCEESVMNREWDSFGLLARNLSSPTVQGIGPPNGPVVAVSKLLDA